MSSAGKTPKASSNAPAVTDADRANAEVAASEYNRYITKFLPQANDLAKSFRDTSFVDAATRGVVERDTAPDTRDANRAGAASVTAATGQRALGAAGRSGVYRAKAGMGGAITAANERKYKGLSALVSVGEGLAGTALQGSRALGQLAANTADINTRAKIEDIENQFNTGQSIRSSVASGLGTYAAYRTPQTPLVPTVNFAAQTNDIVNRSLGRGTPLMLSSARNR